MEFIAITNDVKVAKYFEECGIDDIMVDLETIGKAERQKGLNTVMSNHRFEDITNIKNVLSISKCLVRINPIHENSKDEINETIERGADILMLPMFRRRDEVELFIDLVGDRAEKYLLLETPQALTRVDEILSLNGIDAIHIGLNDLSIGLGLDFLYEPLIGGLIEYLAQKFIAQNLKFGIGGVSKIEKGRNIISEHYRLGSKMVILNRDFRNYKDSYEEIINCDLKKEVEKIDKYITSLESVSPKDLLNNKEELFKEIKQQMHL